MRQRNADGIFSPLPDLHSRERDNERKSRERQICSRDLLLRRRLSEERVKVSLFAPFLLLLSLSPKRESQASSAFAKRRIHNFRFLSSPALFWGGGGKRHRPSRDEFIFFVMSFPVLSRGLIDQEEEEEEDGPHSHTHRGYTSSSSIVKGGRENTRDSIWQSSDLSQASLETRRPGTYSALELASWRSPHDSLSTRGITRRGKTDVGEKTHTRLASSGL